MRTSLPRHLLNLRPSAILVAAALAATAFVGLPSAASASGTATTDPTAGAVITALPGNVAVLHVDGVHYDRVVMPDGSESLPFPTITWAVTQAQKLRGNGHAVRIVVAPGTYREQVTIGSAGSNPPLVLESAEPGRAVVTGADVERRWSPIAGTDLVQAPWPHEWGFAPIPASWDGVSVSDAVRRREAVRVDGAPLKQVLTEDQLTSGTFFVDEAGDRLVVRPPTGVDLADRTVEVAQRDRTLHVRGQADDVTVRGFTFEAAAAPFEKHMAYVSDATDVLLEGNTFRHSSWGGLGLCCGSRITVRDNRSIDNGGNGIDSYKTSGLLLAANTMTGNNVRGAANGYTGWSVAGSKHLLLRDALLTGNTYDANWSRGLWLDTDVSNVVVRGDRACSNFREGFFIEAVQGPVTVEDSTFCTNGQGGIVVATSRDLTIQRSVLSGNGRGNLVFAGERTRTWMDHTTGASITVGDFEAIRLFENQLASGGAAPLVMTPVITLTDWEARLQAGEITARANTWIHPDVDAAIKVRGTSYPKANWDAHTGDGSAAVTTTVTEPPVTTSTTTPAAPGPKKAGNGKGVQVAGKK
jgi:hypothetical protein